MASTLVGALTQALGIALPFAFYTGMSYTLSLITGPVGWGILGLWGLYKLGAPNREKTIPSVLLIGGIRSRITYERSEQLKKLKSEEDRITASIHTYEKGIETADSKTRDLLARRFSLRMLKIV